jgi:hypothetical protein
MAALCRRGLRHREFPWGRGSWAQGQWGAAESRQRPDSRDQTQEKHIRLHACYFLRYLADLRCWEYFHSKECDDGDRQEYVPLFLGEGRGGP